MLRGCRRVSPSGSAGGGTSAGERTRAPRPSVGCQVRSRARCPGGRSTASRRDPRPDGDTCHGRSHGHPAPRPGDDGAGHICPVLAGSPPAAGSAGDVVAVATGQGGGQRDAGGIGYQMVLTAPPAPVNRPSSSPEPTGGQAIPADRTPDVLGGLGAQEARARWRRRRRSSAGSCAPVSSRSRTATTRPVRGRRRGTAHRHLYGQARPLGADLRPGRRARDFDGGTALGPQRRGPQPSSTTADSLRRQQRLRSMATSRVGHRLGETWRCQEMPSEAFLVS